MRLASLAFAVLALAACTPFVGQTAADGGRGPVDMAASDRDMATVDADFAPVYAPSPCLRNTGLYAIGADGMPIDLGTTEAANAMPDEPYCACAPSRHGTGGVRWMTCRAGESLKQCTERGDSMCEEYDAPARALGCSFAEVDRSDPESAPSCVTTQYSIAPCATCTAGVCVVYGDGFTECVSANPDPRPSRNGKPACFAVPGQQRFQTGRTPTENELPTRVACDLRVDCVFLANGEATCGLPAPKLLRYPRRGCAILDENENQCVIRVASGMPEYVDSSSSTTSCSVDRGGGGTAWTDPGLEWSPYRSPPEDIEDCTTLSLCDLTGGSAANCITPEWSIEPFDAGGRCRNCVGIPCFVYEDGSDECNSIPTRAFDGIDNGYCVLKDGEVRAVWCGDGESTACTDRGPARLLEGGVHCTFDVEGLPEVTPL